MNRIGRITVIAALLLALMVGCDTGRGQGAAVGAGIGALIGAGGGRGGMIRGAGIGAAGGYIIGNEADRSRVARRQVVPELAPLAGTSWTLSSITPAEVRPAVSMIIDFRDDGILFTKRTDADGSVTTDEELYRVVGNTLIVNDRDYIINGSFIMEGRTLTFVVGDTTSRWRRIGA